MINKLRNPQMESILYFHNVWAYKAVLCALVSTSDRQSCPDGVSRIIGSVRDQDQCLFCFVCLFFRAVPVARDQIRAVAAGLHHSRSNARALTHWVEPGIKPTSSWILVGLLPPIHNGNSLKPLGLKIHRRNQEEDVFSRALWSLRHFVRSMDSYQNWVWWETSVIQRQGKPICYCIPKNAQEPIVAIDRFKVFSSLKEHIYLGSHAVSVFTLTLLVKWVTRM